MHAERDDRGGGCSKKELFEHKPVEYIVMKRYDVG